MFTRVKKTLRKPSQITLGTIKAVGSLGQTLFTVPTLIKFFTRSKNLYDSALTLPISFLAVAANLMIQTLRVRKMLIPTTSQPTNFSVDQEAAYLDETSDYDDEPSPPQETGNCCCGSNGCFGCPEGLNVLGNVIYFFLKTTGGILPNLSSALSSFLSAYTISEAVAASTGTDAHDAEWKEYLILASGIVFVLASYYSFLSNNYSVIEKNARIYAKSIVEGDMPKNANVLWTVLIASFSVPLVAMLARLSTDATLSKLENFVLKKFLNISINPILKSVLSYASLSTASFQQILSTVPALYKMLERKKQPSLYPDTSPCEKVETGTMTVSITIDTLATGSGNLVGYLHMLSIDNPDNLLAVMLGVIPSLGAGSLNGMFNLQTLHDVQEYHRAQRGEQSYEMAGKENQDHFQLQLEDQYAADTATNSEGAIKIFGANSSAPTLFNQSKTNQSNSKSIEELEFEKEEEDSYRTHCVII